MPSKDFFELDKIQRPPRIPDDADPEIELLELGEEQEIVPIREEVGREFKVSRERIRQIEAQAINKLRRSDLSKKLRNFIENNSSH